MARWWGLTVVLIACGGGQVSRPDAGDPVDAGDPAAVDAGAVPPKSVRFSTPRGTLDGPNAFPVASAQALSQVMDGGSIEVGFQLSDAAQCLDADIDGGWPGSPDGLTHVLIGFVRTFDGSPVARGPHPVVLPGDGGPEGYVQLIEYDPHTGDSRTLLATDGTLTVDAADGGGLDAQVDVHLGDPASQLELPLRGAFHADACSAP